jgi:hypothetical protein
MLKQIRKKNELTNENLSALLGRLDDGASIENNSNQLAISFFTFVDDLKISIKLFLDIDYNRLISFFFCMSYINFIFVSIIFYKDNETQNNSFESSIKEIFLYNEKELLIIEENLSYIGETKSLNNKYQFKFLDSGKVCDIVHLVSSVHLYIFYTNSDRS